MKTQTESKHTPTPWNVSEDGRDLIGADGSRIDEACMEETNQKFMLLAVNSHEALLKIAKAYRNLRRADSNTENDVATYMMIDEAITQAEGK